MCQRDQNKTELAPVFSELPVENAPFQVNHLFIVAFLTTCTQPTMFGCTINAACTVYTAFVLKCNHIIHSTLDVYFINYTNK